MKSSILKTSANREGPIGALFWNLWRNELRTDATELKKILNWQALTRHCKPFNVLTVSIAGSFLAIEIYFFTLANTANAL